MNDAPRDTRSRFPYRCLSESNRPNRPSQAVLTERAASLLERGEFESGAAYGHWQKR